MDRETRLGLLASAILDGTPIDWQSAESTASPGEESVVQQLQILAEIAALHRQPASTASETSAQRPRARADREWGHLQLLEPVGKGNFGEVFRAWDPHLEREVALKLLRTRSASPDPSGSLSDPARVVNEGRLLARVRHPNVITVYGAEPRDGSVGIWMEFIRGRTLQEAIDQQGPLGAREAAGVGMDLCRAVAAVHAARLLHRDVTARNVMREDGGRVVLMDFGVGHEQPHSSDPRAGSDMTGTPLYMAPELFAGSFADQRTDIYSLGVLLFFLVTGTFPVRGTSINGVRQAHERGERVRLRDVRADLPAPFVRAVEKAINVNPVERFQTAGQLEEALDRAIDNVSPAPTTPHLRSWWAVAASIAAVSIMVIGLVSVTRPFDQAAGSRSPDDPAALTALTTRKLSPPDAVWPFSNPSDDGRFVAGRVNDTGDVAIIDLLTSSYRALGMAQPDDAEGYASLGTLSGDGTAIAVDWHDKQGGSLRVIGTDGSAPRVLIGSASDVWVYQWSRDKSMILAVVERDGEKTMALVAASDGAIRPLRRLDASVPLHMSLSPDSRYIAYDDPETPGAIDRDIYILDAHTGNQWPLGPSPGHDSAPFWTPDGRAVVFLSDRNRNASLWMVPVENGQPQSAPRLLKDDVGRVWLHGFTRTGALHYQLWAGFAEVYLASLDGTGSPRPLSPRQVVSNFYPTWSPDGRFVAYASERDLSGRELWVFDTSTGTESPVAMEQRFGRPLGWASDASAILASGFNNSAIYVVDRVNGHLQAVASDADGARWGPAGIVYRTKNTVVVQDPAHRRPSRSFDYSDASIVEFNLSADGRSVMSLANDGTLTLRSTETGQVGEWQDAGGMRLGPHSHAPRRAGVAYIANRTEAGVDEQSLMYWSGSGKARELLRVRAPERMSLGGWLPDDHTLLAVRWTPRPSPLEPRNDTLWRVPIGGEAPTPTGLTMDALRDISVHPDGRQITFNAGFKQAEQWVMENLLPKPEP